MHPEAPPLLLALADPGSLSDGDFSLALKEISPPKPEMGWAPAYHMNMHLRGVETPVGRIVLRIGWTQNLLLYGGHIGYAVEPDHRGKRYAGRAVKLLLPLAWRHGLPEVWITCNPDNLASIRTIESAGGVFVENVLLPPDSDMARRGETSKNRYRIGRP